MSGSILFLVHLIGFGIVFTVILAGWILNRRFTHEEDPRTRLYVGGLMRTIGLLSPLAAAILLISGIGNIFHRYPDAMSRWFTEGWLVAKLIVFVVFLINGIIYGPRLARRRMALAKDITDGNSPKGAETDFALLNNQISLFYVVQIVLLLFILTLSVFGTSKHVGFFG